MLDSLIDLLGVMGLILVLMEILVCENLSLARNEDQRRDERHLKDVR